jgi:hypothetical protein
MITFKHGGNFNNVEKFLSKDRDAQYRAILNRYGQIGVNALVSVTPVDTGITSESWRYEITSIKGGYVIIWSNIHVVDGINIAAIVQYGHGTRSGGYIQGRDYINPVMKPIFDKIADDLYKEVTGL